MARGGRQGPTIHKGGVGLDGKKMKERLEFRRRVHGDTKAENGNPARRAPGSNKKSYPLPKKKG